MTIEGTGTTARNELGARAIAIKAIDRTQFRGTEGVQVIGRLSPVLVDAILDALSAAGYEVCKLQRIGWRSYASGDFVPTGPLIDASQFDVSPDWEPVFRKLDVHKEG